MTPHRHQLRCLLSLAAIALTGCALSDIDPEADTAEIVAAVAPSPNDETAFEFFVDKGLTAVQAAGVVGNLDQESQMNPSAAQPGGPGRGIAQWSVGGRWDTSPDDNVLAFARDRGASPTSLLLQLEFVWYELVTFPGYGLADLRAATTIRDAVIAFERKFERCGVCNEAQRIAFAQAAFDAYGSRPPPPPPVVEIAFQSNTHSLWTVGTALNRDWELGMMPGTSPSITPLVGGGFQVAFQSNTGQLWTVGTAGNRNWQLGMKAGTSPAITALWGGGFQVAFQSNTGQLWTVGNAGNRNWELGMRADTSPSIAGLPGGGFEVAFQSNTGQLWTVGNAVNRNWELGMRAGTSPSIMPLLSGGFEVAFQSNTGQLWTVGNALNRNWELGMKAGTSPHIAPLPGGGFQVVFQANTGSLWKAGDGGTGNLHLGLDPGSSPSGT